MIAPAPNSMAAREPAFAVGIAAAPVEEPEPVAEASLAVAAENCVEAGTTELLRPIRKGTLTCERLVLLPDNFGFFTFAVSI